MSQLDAVMERQVAPSAGTIDMKLEVVVIPVSDLRIDHADDRAAAPRAAGTASRLRPALRRAGSSRLIRRHLDPA